MTQQSRLEALVSAIGADVKSLLSGSANANFPAHYPITRTDFPHYYPVYGAANTVTATQSRLYYIPVVVSRPVRIVTVGFEVLTAATGSSARMGLYASDANYRPGAKISDIFTTVATSSTGIKSLNFPAPLYMNANTVYWVAIVVQGGAPSLRGRASSDRYISELTATPSFVVSSAFYQNTVTGALPEQATLVNNVNGPAIYVQYSEP